MFSRWIIRGMGIAHADALRDGVGRELLVCGRSLWEIR